jgi:MOSC domain-containing protein YiiM
MQMIALDPDTGKTSMEVLRQVSKAHDGKAGVYGAVLVEGTIRHGDAVELLA